MKRFRIHSWIALALLCGIPFSASAESMDALLQQADRVRTSDLHEFNRLIERLDRMEGQATVAQREQLRLLHAHRALMRGDVDGAAVILEALATSAGDPVLRHRAGALQANTFAISRRFEEGLRRLESLLPQTDSIEDAAARHQGLLAAGILYNQVGEFGLGRRHAQRVLSEGSSERNLCIARNLVLEARLGAGERLDEPPIRAAINGCEAESEAILAGFSYSYLARNLHAVGKTLEAIDTLQAYLPTVEKAGYPLLTGEYHSMLAEYRMQQGDVAAAERHAARTVEYMTSLTNAMSLVTAFRTLYEVAMQRGDLEMALEMYRRFAEADRAYLQEVRARQMAYRIVRHEAQQQAQEIELLNERNTVLALQQRVSEQRAQNRGLLVLLLGVLTASIAAWGWRTKRVQMRLRRMAEVDMLTGISNRHHFSEMAHRVLAQCLRTGEPAALVMFDLDHFKQVNDRFGHAAGDWALKQVAQVCSALCRPVDVFGRLGGEEFAILLPGLGLREGRRLAEDARARLTAIDSSASGSRMNISASFGVTDTGLSGFGFNRLLSHADRALYRAKRGGRNQVCEYRVEKVARLAVVAGREEAGQEPDAHVLQS